MHIIDELIRPLRLLSNLEDIVDVFTRPTRPLEQSVLELELRDAKFEDNLFSDLTVNGDPVRARLFHDFHFIERFKSETSLVYICEDKLLDFGLGT